MLPSQLRWIVVAVMLAAAGAGAKAAWPPLDDAGAKAAQSLGGANAGAEPPAAPGMLHIKRASTPPRLKDYLNGRARDEETRVTGFRQYQPGDGDPVSRDTTAYLSYDDKNLYVIFVCADERANIRAHMVAREDIGDDDRVGVVLDTFHDRRRAYQFYVNPLGIQADSITTEGQKDDTSFDTVWRSQGQVTAEGYVVWIAIPFRSLRFSGRAADPWGIALSRVIVRNNETSYWPYVTSRVQGFVHQLAALGGLEGISPGDNGIQVIPHATGSRARYLDSGSATPAIRRTTDASAGMDLKGVLGDRISLDITANPDVSEVESDRPQVTINRRFVVVFPEKRPFFTENAGFFQVETGESLFYSRRIADPQFGSRLTGKAGKWLFGALAMDDRAPGESVAPGNSLFGARARIGVARVEREFGKQSSVGVFFYDRYLRFGWNRVAAFDTRLRLNSHWTLSLLAAGSLTRNQDRSEQHGTDYAALLKRDGRHFYYGGNFVDRSPGFNAQLGVLDRVDIRSTAHEMGYLWRPKSRWLLDFGPILSAYSVWNNRNQMQDRSEGGGFQADFARQTHLETRYSHGFERFGNVNFRRNYQSVAFWTSWYKPVSLAASYGWGAGINYYPAGDLSPFSAQQTDTSLKVDIHFTRRLRWDNDYTYSRLGTHAGLQPAGVTANAAVFIDHIVRSKVNYQLTQALSLRAILDYDAVLSNAALIGDPTTKHAGGDFLVTYLVTPGTAVYAGYTDGYDNLAIDAGLPPTLRYTRLPGTPAGRQLFVKLSYLFRY